MNMCELRMIIIFLFISINVCFLKAQEEAETPKPPIISSRDIVLNCTPHWMGERMEDGRPYV